MSKASDIFIDELKASMVQKIADETIKLWKRRAGEYSLTATQWNAVLNRLIAENEGGFMLPWPTIKYAIECIKEEGVGRNLGTLNFELNGNPNWGIRVKNVNGEWLSLKTGKPPNLPAEAYNIQIHPDYPAEPEPQDRAEPAFIQQILEQEILPNLEKKGVKDALEAKEELVDVPF